MIAENLVNLLIFSILKGNSKLLVMKTAEKQSGATTKTTVSANGKTTTLNVVKTTEKAKTVDDRIKSLEKLQIIIDRRAKVKASFEKLEKFNLGSEGQSVGLTFKAADGEIFHTSNATAFEEVKKTLVRVTGEALTKMDNEIQEFNI